MRIGGSKLQWLIAGPVFLVAALVLLQFGQMFACCHRLRVAASAGGREALLPGATADSVRKVVAQNLAGVEWAEYVDPVMVTLDDRIALAEIDPPPGSSVTVRLQVDRDSLPRWFRLRPLADRAALLHIEYRAIAE
jgi:hypothetical protein